MEVICKMDHVRDCCFQVEGSGEVFNHTYSPQGSTSNWLGLHRASGFANYVAVSEPALCLEDAVCVCVSV